MTLSSSSSLQPPTPHNSPLSLQVPFADLMRDRAAVEALAEHADALHTTFVMPAHISACLSSASDESIDADMRQRLLQSFAGLLVTVLHQGTSKMSRSARSGLCRGKRCGTPRAAHTHAPLSFAVGSASSIRCPTTPCFSPPCGSTFESAAHAVSSSPRLGSLYSHDIAQVDAATGKRHSRSSRKAHCASAGDQ